MKTRGFLFLITAVLFVICLPYLYAYLVGGDEYYFFGFLNNPVDGASYLAKMVQGQSGSWQFTLPFTAQPGEGVTLFLFYLFLGHLSRWTSLPTVFVFHLARIIGSVLFITALAVFFQKVFRNRKDLFWISLVLASFGSGMGWLEIPFGLTPFDMWVTEAYPFLSMFSNAHFSLGLALFVTLLNLVLTPANIPRHIWLAIVGLLLSIIYPFGLVMAVVLMVGWAVWTWLDTRFLDWQAVLFTGLLGGPFLLYQYSTSVTHPILSNWNSQNITLTPAIWDVAISLLPVLLLAAVGGFFLINDRGNQERRILILWPALSLILMYVPLSLQRRFSLGLYIPLAALAVFGFDWLASKYPMRRKIFIVFLFSLSMLTNVLYLAVLTAGAGSHPPVLYLTRDEYKAISWMKDEIPAQSVVLASPETSLFIPAFFPGRVIYGHPYETANAEIEKQKVINFYSHPGDSEESQALLQQEKVAYIYYGPREQSIRPNAWSPDSWTLVFESGPVRIYQVSPGQ